MSDSDLEDELVDSAPWLMTNRADAREFIRRARENGELVGSEWRGNLEDETTRNRLFEDFAKGRS